MILGLLWAAVLVMRLKRRALLWLSPECKSWGTMSVYTMGRNQRGFTELK